MQYSQLEASGLDVLRICLGVDYGLQEIRQ